MTSLISKSPFTGSKSLEKQQAEEMWKLKPALRRHRRRLARIVVDCWLYKTKTRLLVLRLRKILQKYLKISCFKAMRRFAVTSVEKREKKQIAMDFCLTSSKKRAFHAWIMYHKLELHRWAAMSQLFELAKRRRCKELLCVWHKQAQQQMQSRRHFLIAEQFWSLSLLSTCFMNWQLGMHSLQKNKHLTRLALGFWAHKRLSISWQAFKKLVDLRHAILNLSKKRREQLMASLFKRWRDFTFENLKELQKHALYARNKSLLLRSFTSLRDHVLWKRSYNQIKHRALSFYNDQCMHCTYKAWHDYVEIRHVNRRLAAATQAHLKKKLMRSAFNRWRRLTQIKKKEGCVTAAYEYKLCSKCMHIWKEHMHLKTSVCNCRDLSLRHTQKQAFCRLPYVVKLLRSQNRLLQQRFSFVAKWSHRRIFRKRRINSIIISQAHSFYKKCILELKCAAQKDVKKKRKENGCCDGTGRIYNSENVPRKRKASIPGMQDSVCNDAARNMEISCENEGRSNLISVTQPLIISPAPHITNEGPRFFKAGFALPGIINAGRTTAGKSPTIQEAKIVLESSRGRASRRQRLPPRIPPYLTEASAFQDSFRKAHPTSFTDLHRTNCSLAPLAYEAKHEDNASKHLGKVALPLYVSEASKDLRPVLTEGNFSILEESESKRSNLIRAAHIGHKDGMNKILSEKHLSDPKLIREELIWTEDLLCSFNKLEEELCQKGAELSALRERHDSVPDDKFKSDQIRYSEQKIMLLHERQSILLPIIQGLASRAGALHRSCFGKGSQVLHLD